MAVVWAAIACLVIWLVLSSEARSGYPVTVTAAGGKPTLFAGWDRLLTLAAIAAAAWLAQKLVRGRPLEWLTLGLAVCGAAALAMIATYCQHPSPVGVGAQPQRCNRKESLRAAGLFLLLGALGLVTRSVAATVLLWGALLGVALALVAARERR